MWKLAKSVFVAALLAVAPMAYADLESFTAACRQNSPFMATVERSQAHEFASRDCPNLFFARRCLNAMLPEPHFEGYDIRESAEIAAIAIDADMAKKRLRCVKACEDDGVGTACAMLGLLAHESATSNREQAIDPSLTFVQPLRYFGKACELGVGKACLEAATLASELLPNAFSKELDICQTQSGSDCAFLFELQALAIKQMGKQSAITFAAKGCSLEVGRACLIGAKLLAQYPDIDVHADFDAAVFVKGACVHGSKIECRQAEKLQ